VPLSAILISAGFFFSLLLPAATEPSGAVKLIYAGAVILTISVITLAIGLIRTLPATQDSYLSAATMAGERT
jgi:hypothetical protein